MRDLMQISSKMLQEQNARQAARRAKRGGETAETIRLRGTSRDQCTNCGLDHVLFFVSLTCPRCGEKREGR